MMNIAISKRGFFTSTSLEKREATRLADNLWKLLIMLEYRHTVDGRLREEVRRSPPGMYKTGATNTGINYQPQLVSRISSINSR